MEELDLRSRLGAQYAGNGNCQFLVWAPAVDRVDVHILSPKESQRRLEKDGRGYHRGTVENVEPGSIYLYRLDNRIERPDPASRSQPQGVHGPSEVVDSEFPWEDAKWRGIPLKEYIIYELHVGTFTMNGTFIDIIPFIRKLKQLGITGLELMPVTQFAGSRNWGYDSVYPFAVQNSYDGSIGLKSLVNACHKEGLAVILDVIFNHLGTEGNCFEHFGPYFSDYYSTPWGKAINFDGPYSDEVRRFFIENANYWYTEFHIDALRLDALHAIRDFSPKPFLEELAQSVKGLKKRLGRNIYLIGESDSNDRRLICTAKRGGFGLDAQWNDDFHHALHVLVTGDNTGYYQDFGKVEQLAKAFREGFVYSGQYSPFRKRRHGSSSADIKADKFVVFIQNHDQVGNYMKGTRLSQTVTFDKQKLAAGAVVLSPFIPLIFMGEEYGETAPFQYFTSHSDPGLIEGTYRGRCEEFADFQWQGEVPDPQDELTFLNSKLDRSLEGNGQHRILLNYYKELFHLRKKTAALRFLNKKNMEVHAFEELKLIYINRWKSTNEAAIVMNFAEQPVTIKLPFNNGQWHKLLDSEDKQWLGKGSWLPDDFKSTGEFQLTMERNSLALFIRREKV